MSKRKLNGQDRALLQKFKEDGHKITRANLIPSEEQERPLLVGSGRGGNGNDGKRREKGNVRRGKGEDGDRIPFPPTKINHVMCKRKIASWKALPNVPPPPSR